MQYMQKSHETMHINTTPQ